MCIYICAFFFILIKYAARDRIAVIRVGHFPPFWFLGTWRKNCQAHVVRPRMPCSYFKKRCPSAEFNVVMLHCHV